MLLRAVMLPCVPVLRVFFYIHPALKLFSDSEVDRGYIDSIRPAQECLVENLPYSH